MDKKKGVNSKTFAVLLVMVLVIGCVIGGSVAWLVSNPDSVVNTFTYGDINITLAETTGNSFKILPGNDISKDPKVTVQANSEACWLFVKVDESNWPTFTEGTPATRKVNYAIAEGWTALDGVPGVYYREVDATSSTGEEFSVLKNNKVTVSENLTKAEVNEINKTKTANNAQTQLTFTAYAVQRDQNIVAIDTPAEAWEIANPQPQA